MDASNYLWKYLYMQEGHEWFSNYSRGRQEIFMSLAVLLCEQFCRFANGDAEISIKSYFMRSFICLVFCSSEVFGKIASIRSKLPTAACLVSGRKEREM